MFFPPPGFFLDLDPVVAPDVFFVAQGGLGNEIRGLTTVKELDDGP